MLPFPFQGELPAEALSAERMSLRIQSAYISLRGPPLPAPGECRCFCWSRKYSVPTGGFGTTGTGSTHGATTPTVAVSRASCRQPRAGTVQGYQMLSTAYFISRFTLKLMNNLVRDNIHTKALFYHLLILSP